MNRSESYTTHFHFYSTREEQKNTERNAHFSLPRQKGAITNCKYLPVVPFQHINTGDQLSLSRAGAITSRYIDIGVPSVHDKYRRFLSEKKWLAMRGGGGGPIGPPPPPPAPPPPPPPPPPPKRHSRPPTQLFLADYTSFYSAAKSRAMQKRKRKGSKIWLQPRQSRSSSSRRVREASCGFDVDS
jgi:hypothetical protein